MADFTEPFGGELATTPELPRPKSKAEYEALSFGSQYVSPEGETLTKYYRPKSVKEYADVPEGSEYIAPTGEKLTKKKTEALNFTTQTLYNMAVNEQERKRALEYGYPGKVRENPHTGELEVVEEGGVVRRPKGFTQSPGAFVAGMAAPTAGAFLGAVGGGMAGGVGALPGSVGGAIAGQTINDMILGFTGIAHRDIKEQAAVTGLAGASAMAGAGVGKGLATVGGAVGLTKYGLPAALANFMGATSEGVRQALALRSKGVMVPPSTWAHEAPYLINMSEIFDPAFRRQQPYQQSLAAHYESTGQTILEQAGVKPPEGELLKPTAAVPLHATGERLKARAIDELKRAEEELDRQIEAQKQAAVAGQREVMPFDMNSLQRSANNARRAADTLVKQGFEEIQRDVNQAMGAVKAGHNSGDLWWSVGEKLKELRSGIMGQAKIMYNKANMAAGTHLPDIGGLPEIARDFLSQLPEGFENRYPSIVKQLRDLGGVEELDAHGMPTGEWKKEPVHPTFGQLHNLRSYLRDNYNHLDLTPDIKEGVFKYFAAHVDSILNAPGQVPELQAAARLLRDADAFYRENMSVFRDRQIQAVMDGLRSGMPADAKKLFDVLVKEGKSDVTRQVREMIGPNLWAGVKAADVQDMLDMSKTLQPGIIDGRRFAAQVLDRDRRGMLVAVHGPEASEQLIRQAQAVEALEGRIDIPSKPGDTLFETIQRARIAGQAAELAAKIDPIGMLEKEMHNIEREGMRAKTEIARRLEQHPLGFLFKPTTGAARAVENILDSEDLTLAVIERFKPDSPEVKMLQQTALQRILTGSWQPSKKLAKLTPEVQQALFPGTTLEQLQLLAKETDFLLGSTAFSFDPGAGASMAAQARVNNPWGALGKIPGARLMGKITFLEPGARFALGKYYSLVTKIMNSPRLMRLVEKGLQGDEIARGRVRDMVQRTMRRGAATGAGVGEATYQAQEPEQSPRPMPPPVNSVTRFDAQGNPL